MSEKVSVSIIVTAYNQEKYIRNCLDSIANQSLKDMEVVIVDDGSTDKTAFICQEFVDNDSRFRYVYQENQGVSAARNRGIKKAQGQWIGFVDGDDILSKTMVEVLYRNAQESHCFVSACEILKLEAQDFSKPIQDQIRDPKNKRDTSEVLKDKNLWAYFFNYADGFILWSPCNKLYHHSLLQDQTFDTHYSNAEDMLFNYQILKKENAIVFDPSVSYGYVHHRGSASQPKGFYAQREQTIQVSQWIEQDMKTDENLSCYRRYAQENSYRHIKQYLINYVRCGMRQEEYKKKFNSYRYQLLKNYPIWVKPIPRMILAVCPQSILIKDVLTGKR